MSVYSDEVMAAYETRDIEEFLSLAFPSEWDGLAARILETGATFADKEGCKWAPRWSRIPLTIRRGDTDIETAYKSVIFRVHDCLHQLWGLPHPKNFSEEEFYYYKRTQMCGEVAVLTLTEFVYALHLFDLADELSVRDMLWSRNAIPLLIGGGPLAGKTTLQIGMRLDDLLHKKSRPKWVRDNPYAVAFVDDYVPMLERDRQQIDINWEAMKQASWYPTGAPRAKFARHLDGLELTIWMLNDFEHLLTTDSVADTDLMYYNRERRDRLVLPDGWDS